MSAPAPTSAALPRPTIDVAELVKTYSSAAGDVPVLKGVDLRADAGTWTALMGPSGSGKSTFLYCCAGLIRATSGSVHLDGTDITGAAEKELTDMRRTRVGFVFQQYNLIPALTAAQNVALPSLFDGTKPPRADVVGALESMGLGHRVDHHPEQLSGGEQQRVAIARTLLQKPSVVFADEPTGALESVSGARVLRQFTALTERGACVLMVTHDPVVAARADRVLFLLDGQIVEEKAGAPVEEIAHRIATLEQITGE